MFENANRDIERLTREAVARRIRQQQLDRVVHAIDDLLIQLEDLNLQGVDRVPARLRERAGQILEPVPGPEDDVPAPRPAAPDLRGQRRRAGSPSNRRTPSSRPDPQSVKSTRGAAE